MRVFTVDCRSPLGTLALRGVDLAELVTRPLGHRGLFKLARWCGQLAPPDQRCTVELEADARFVFLTRDPYWNRVISKRFHYEWELQIVLRQLADVDYWFIDAGANYGYWSALVTSQSYGAKSAIAIEPVTTTFRALQENCALNGGRFRPVQLAVAEESGRRVVIHYPRQNTGTNASASMVQTSRGLEAMECESVESISIDALLREFVTVDVPIVLKLDVEGMEVPALRGGASALSEREWLVIYEDHGSDAECRTSEFVMTLDASIFLVNHRGAMSPVHTLDQVREFKTNERRGYNLFAASRGSVFERRLAEISVASAG